MMMKALKACVLSALLMTGFNAVACEDLEVEHPHADFSDDVVTDVELEIIRERVLKRCGLSSRLAENKLPWYFHYEFGMELIKEGAAAQAIEPLQMTANLKSESARGTRMYGMWFVNYLPYYQMSLAYSELGEWELAWDALQMSEQLVEFSPGDFEYDKFESLKSLIEQKRQATS
jgi:hypothetical protein